MTEQNTSITIPGYDTATPVIVRQDETGDYVCVYRSASWSRSDVPDAEKSAYGVGKTAQDAKSAFVADAIRRLRA